MKSYRKMVDASHIGGMKVAVSFSDGTSGVFDFAPFSSYPCYAPLLDPDVFSRVSAEHGTLSWPNGIDMSPECVWSMTDFSDRAENA